MPALSWIRIAIGVLTAALGTLPFLAALNIIPSRAPHPGDAPAWIGLAVGSAFFLAGIVSIVNGLEGGNDSSGELSATAPRAVRAVYKLMGGSITILLAVLLTWVAFGPGERHFLVSVDGISVSGGHEFMGRALFGAVAILAWVLVGGVMLVRARRWYSQR